MNALCKRAVFLSLVSLIQATGLRCQVIISTDDPDQDTSAVLKVQAVDKGFLPPCMALVSADLPAPVTSPAAGLIVYNTAHSGNLSNSVCPGLYYWSGQRWIRFDDGVKCGYTPLPDNCNPAGTVEDINSNLYPTIAIGNQEWMAENLKVTRYNDGTLIPNVTDGSEWTSLSTGARCWYENDSSNGNIYGALYNWQAVYHDSLFNLCPKGWHVPSDEEWMALSDFLGGENIAGGKIKESDTLHWQAPNTGAVNSTCFSALPAGEFNGIFAYLNSDARFWSSTEDDAYHAWNRGLGYSTARLTRNSIGKNSGYSVRCIKDCQNHPTPSDAGNDSVNILNDSTILEGNTPNTGLGFWQVIYGTGGNISDPYNPSSIFTGVAGHYYKLRWTITTDCDASTDDVEISFYCPTTPTIADAGPDQQEVMSTSTTLQGNAPLAGTGQWSIISGYGGSVADASDPATTLTGIEGHTYTLRWTIIACSSSEDDVMVSFACPAADAGPDQFNVSGDSTNLQGNNPFTGIGLWSIIAGTGGNIANPSDPQSAFTGVPGGSGYTLRWAVTSDCFPAMDDVQL